MVHFPSSYSYLGFRIRVSSDAVCNAFSPPIILLLIAHASRSKKYAGQLGKFGHRSIIITSQHIKPSEGFAFTRFFNPIFTLQGLLEMQCEKTLKHHKHYEKLIVDCN